MKNAHSCWMAPERLVRITDFSARQGLKEKNLLSLQAEARDRVSALNTSAALERFFTRAADLPERARKLSKGAPDLALQIRQTARKIRDHRIDLLASGPLFFGRPIAWHSDIRSGYRWDPTLDYQAAPDGLDRLIETGGGVELKAPWDLSNLHGLPTLTAAWGLDRDPAVLQAIEKDVTDWIEANPPFLGVNWYCAMNVAMRALSLLTTIAALYPDLNPEFLRAVLTSLYLHAVRIGAHLEHGRGGQRNNHYLSDLIGLYFLGTLFRDTPAGSEWLAFSIDELEIEAGLQFHPDGVCIEDSTSYHRFSTEILLLCAIQGEAAGRPFSTTFVDRLRKSLRFTLDILPSHHLIPQIGDNDNGRMLPLFGYQTLPGTDHRHILALGGEFFDDDSLRRAGADARGDALWFLGRWTEPAADRPPQPTGLFSYADSGFHGLRDDLILLLIHNNRIRPEHGGGHTHCDALSFTLTLQDRDLFVDAGVWNYSADIDGRNDFRSTAYHNTVQLKDGEIHSFERGLRSALWRMEDRAGAQTLHWGPDGDRILFRGSVDSYREKTGLRVFRDISWNRSAARLSVLDSVQAVRSSDSTGIVTAVSRFLLAPGISIRPVGEQKLDLYAGADRLARFSTSPGVALSVRNLWFSPQYGERIPTLQIEGSWRADEAAPASFEILLHP